MRGPTQWEARRKRLRGRRGEADAVSAERPTQWESRCKRRASASTSAGGAGVRNAGAPASASTRASCESVKSARAPASASITARGASVRSAIAQAPRRSSTNYASGSSQLPATGKRKKPSGGPDGTAAAKRSKVAKKEGETAEPQPPSSARAQRLGTLFCVCGRCCNNSHQRLAEVSCPRNAPVPCVISVVSCGQFFFPM